jgi:hypothetical protein
VSEYPPKTTCSEKLNSNNVSGFSSGGGDMRFDFGQEVDYPEVSSWCSSASQEARSSGTYKYLTLTSCQILPISPIVIAPYQPTTADRRGKQPQHR